jgi:hypothetical protein
MRTTRFRRPPVAIRRAKLDNLALVPGSMLPHMEACQESANRLPKGAVLIVLPHDNEAQKRTMLLVAKLLATEEHQVALIPASELRKHQRG